MIDFKRHNIKYDPKTDYNVVINDLVALGNVDKNTVDTIVLQDDLTSMILEGVFDVPKGYAVVGGEIIYINSYTKLIEDKKVVIYADRGLRGTLTEDQTSNRFRTVKLVESENNMDLLSWDYEDTIGNISSTLFPCEVGSGSLVIGSKIELWSPIIDSRTFWVRPRKSVVYIFKGVGENRFLKHTLLVNKMTLLSKTSGGVQKIKMELKSKLAQWYEKDLAVNINFKDTSPIHFFEQLFNLKRGEVYYADGVGDDSFVKINNLNSREYGKFSELLKAYCSNGVRFCFDRFERVKVFSDFKVSKITQQKTISEDVLTPSMTTDEKLVYNTVSTEVVQRLSMYNYEDLGFRGVSYANKLDSIITSDKLMEKNKNGGYDIKMVEIRNSSLTNHIAMNDIVCFKSKVEPYIEVFSRVIDITVDGTVMIYPITSDKDNLLFLNGKGDFLYNSLIAVPKYMDLYYSRNELPIVSKLSRSIGGKERDSNLLYPILPRVDGAYVHRDTKNFKFGCATNIKVGSYTGIVENIESLYGSFDKTKLLYNQEIAQFNGTNPPLFVLSNQVKEKTLNDTAFVMDFTTFDNSDLVLNVSKPTDNEYDYTVEFLNSKGVNSNIDLYVDEEIDRLSNKIIEVSSLDNYTVGDVLIVNRPEDLNSIEEKEFDEILSQIKWTVLKKIIAGKKYYLEVDSDFARRQQINKKYKYTRYPSWSIVFVQEMYVRGNPVLEFSQKVTQSSKDVNFEGDTSVAIYGEKKYNLDSKQLNKDGIAKLLGYILTHCQSTDISTTKIYVPISTFNGIDIELLDVICVKEPTYTKITDNIKWLVTSISDKSGTNTVQLKLLNLNSKDTEPFKLEVKDMLEYAPVDIPTYSPSGGEGGEEPDNGEGGEGYDSSIGTFQMATVDPQIFRAYVDKYEDRKIYFKDFGGTEWTTYVGKLFPNAEFGVLINGVTFLVKADMDYRALIRKSDIYNTKYNVDILEGDEIHFLTMSYYVDIDGKFYSRSCKIGDGGSYFEYDINKGAKFVGDFVVGEGSEHAGNDLWESLQKNRVFQQPYPPTSDDSYTLRLGDLWYDTDDQNHPYTYNGGVWVSCRDNSIIDAHNNTFIQPTEPESTPTKPLKEGDMWYASGNKNKPYVYKDGEWVNVTDGNLEDAIEDARIQIEGMMKDLEDMSDDGVIVPLEKKGLLREWETIEEEYPKNLEKALVFNANPSTYTYAYNELKRYIKPILAEMYENSYIDGEEFRGLFQYYYTQEISLTGVIYDNIKGSAIKESKDYADEIDDKLLSYMDDGVITPNEKADLRFEILTIENRANTLKTRAGAFEVSSTALIQCVDKLIIWKNGVLAQQGIYQDVLQVNSLRNAFKDYYSEEEKVYDGIERKSKLLADNAQNSATNALNTLGDIASDNKLTPSEKQETLKEWNIIKSQYATNVNKANVYGASITNYTSKYNALNTYITPLLSNLSTTSNIVGSVFRTTFEEYYTEEVKLITTMYDKILDKSVSQSQKYADSIDNKLTGYLSDGVLTPQEKGDLRFEVLTIEDRSTTLKRRASSWGINVSALTTFVTKLTSWKNGILSQDGIYSDLNKVNELRQDFRNYYQEEESVYDLTERKVKEYADNAQNSANSALNSLTDIANDNKLTPDEKQITLKEWDNIKNQYSLLLNKATNLGTSTTAYTNIYQALNTYITPLLADIKTTSNIVGTTFRTNFSEYYRQETSLVNNMYDKIVDKSVSQSQQYADNIDNKFTGYLADGVLTPQEKGSLRYEVMTVEDRANVLKARAVVFGVSTTKLTEYVGHLVSWKNGILNQPGIYQDYNMVNLIRQGFRNYYTEEESVYDLIERKAKDLSDKAQADANASLNLLTDIASDNKLTASEKQSTKKEWDVIVAEYPKNIAQANAYGVSTADYTSKYNTLNSYITPLLSNLSSTSNIVGSIFRANFKNYYEAEIVLTGSIYTKIKDVAVSEAVINAEAKLNSYMKDGVLSPQEKGDLRYDILTIESRFATLKPRADVFGVSTTTLTNLVNHLILLKNGILSAPDMLDNLTQVNTVRKAFMDYYVEEERVTGNIERKAKELADKAQSDADGALNTLTDIASDNKLTASEKSQTKKEWDIIYGEYSKILIEARKFSVSVTAYTNYYNTLNAYLSPLLNTMNTTSNIVGNTFRMHFANYYSERQTVLNGISDGISNTASMQNGKMLYLDPTFKNGRNSINVYNNSNNGTVTHAIQTGSQFGVLPPNDTNNVLVITKAAGTSSPNMGGFHFSTPTKSGMRLLTKIVACIPTGHRIAWASNATGTNSENYWVTETEGIGAFKEYTHVLKCGVSGTFSSTAFFYLIPTDGNATKAVKWGLSYATVFDSGANESEYITTALGNSKIFHSPTAPTSGMKTNDLWYDTDDQNHPYAYNGSIWVSCRDKVFETAGGNKVYFQTSQPPTTGTGVKDGDMWFKTNENNKMYILMNKVWVLADDSKDNIANGRIILNGNTTVNGSFKVSGSSVELNANTSVTGLMNVYGSGKGMVVWNGTTQSNSTRKIVITGSGIEFWENV